MGIDGAIGNMLRYIRKIFKTLIFHKQSRHVFYKGSALLMREANMKTNKGGAEARGCTSHLIIYAAAGARDVKKFWYRKRGDKSD